MGTAGLNTLIQPFFLTKSSYSAKLICTSVSDSIYLSSVPLTVLVRKDEACGESDPQRHLFVLLKRRSLKKFPTVIPIVAPMIAPATKSENQWIVIETPTPM
jgi:hypothetical protein